MWPLRTGGGSISLQCPSLSMSRRCWAPVAVWQREALCPSSKSLFGTKKKTEFSPLTSLPWPLAHWQTWFTACFPLSTKTHMVSRVVLSYSTFLLYQGSKSMLNEWTCRRGNGKRNFLLHIFIQEKPNHLFFPVQSLRVLNAAISTSISSITLGEVSVITFHFTALQLLDASTPQFTV